MRQMLSKVANRAGRPTGLGSIAALAVVALAAAGCGSSSGPSGNSSSTTSGQAGGTFTILANSAFGVADPAQNYTLEEWQLLINTHDGLTAFARVGGVAGTKIVPDLATAIPVPTNGGKTYLFHVRRGIKFSNGQVLKPSDFLTTFERQFTVPGGNPGFYSGIVGTSACSTKGCNLSKGVVANDSNYTLTINAAMTLRALSPAAWTASQPNGRRSAVIQPTTAKSTLSTYSATTTTFPPLP